MTWDGRVRFLVSSADPDSDSPVWVDLTLRVRDVVQSIQVDTGRQDDLEGSTPTVFTLLLDNADDALTFGNTASPYFGWWGPGRKCWLQEVVGGTTMDLATGYLQTPTEGLVTSGIEQRVTLSIVDRLGRLGSGEPFISTLAAHIKASVRNNVLFGYWPLLDDSTTQFADAAGTTPAVTTLLQSSLPNVERSPHVEAQAGMQIPGDDATPVLMVPGLNAGVVAWGVSINVNFNLATVNFPVLSPGQVATAVLWLSYRADSVLTGSVLSPMTLAHADGLIDLQRSNSGSADFFRLTSPLGSLTGNVSASSGSAEAVDRYYILGMRFGYTPNVLELWVDDQIYTAVLAGVLTGPLNISGLQCISFGSAAHMQLYVGAPADFTRTDFLAQRQIGLTGLERQSTGERIATVARYAGVRGGEMSIDPGTTVMQKAELAGQTALDAIRDAERTEQGLAYADGSGVIQFRDRRSLYNI